MRHFESLESRLLLALPAVTTVDLDGTWQLQRTDVADLASLGTTWTNVTVPSLMPWESQRYAWYRTSLNVASNWQGAGGHVFLEFDAVRYVSDIYLNGVRVGGHFGGWEPFQVDVTGLCTPGGTDQLLVRVQDIRGVLTDPNVPYDPGTTPADGSGNNVLAPVGSQPRLFGIWQDVRLAYHPDVYIADVAISTSLRQHKLDATYTLRNLGATAKQVTLDPQVMDGGSMALDLSPRVVTVPAGSSLQVSFSQAWANPSLWMPDSPHLYYLNASLSDAGGALGSDSERFGFREFWVQGTQFYLNGTPMTFLATAGHPDWTGKLLSDDEVRSAFEGIRSAGAMAMRLHANIWPANWYNVADEIGLPIVLESAIWCDSNAYALDNAAFWQNARDHWSGVIAAHRNHPSVVMYSIENEIMLCGGGRVSTTQKNLGDLGRYVKGLDPTRPIMFEGDDDPDGAADIINLHYPHEFPKYLDYPNTADWLDEPTVPDTYPYTTWQWSRQKPLYMGEFLWMFQQTNSGYTGVLGDDAYGEDANRRAKAEAWRYQIEAFRKAGLAGIDPWTLWESGTFPNVLYDVIKETYQPNGAYVEEYDNRFFSAQQVQRTINLYNDTLYAANLTLEWRLNGQVQGQSTFAMQPAGHVNTTITLSMPAVTAQQGASFELIVRNGANVVYSKTRTYQVYPASAGQLNLPAGKRIAVYQGSGGDGTAAALLQASGITPLILTDLANARSLSPDLLIIEAHALDNYLPGAIPMVAGGAAAELRNYMRAGGTILVLEQNAMPEGLLPASIMAAPTTIGFVRESTHPAVQGLDDSAFTFWRGDHYVAQYAIRKPSSGGFRVLADAGQADGLERVLAMESLQGRGRLVMSQLLISGKYGMEPMARVLLKRLVEYGASAPAQSAPVGVVDADGSIQADLGALGVAYQNLTGLLATANLSSFKVILVDARSAEVTAQKAKLKAFAQAGGSVVLHGADAAVMAALGSSVPGGLTVVPSMTVPVLVSNRTDTVSAGMMSEDLNWTTGPAPSWYDMMPLDTTVLLGAVTRQPPALADCTTIEAESMSAPPAGTGNVSGGQVQLWTNASIQTTVNLPSTSTYFLGVYGYGTPVRGVYPNIAVYIDEQLAGYVTVAANTGLYGFTAQAAAGAHTLRLAFTNDAYDPANGEDRNVWLDKFAYKAVGTGPEVALLQPGGLVRVNDGAGRWVIDEVNWDGRIAASARPARYLINLLDNLGAQFPVDDSITIPAANLQPTGSGPWQLGSDGVLGIYADMTFTTQVDFRRTGTYQITMAVRGNLAGGAYSIARALLDGALVGDYQCTSANWEQATFTVSVTAGTHTVGVRFPNDYWSTTEDRNLWVKSVRIRPLSLVNAAPTDIGLTNASIAENRPAGSVVGTFWTVDPDALDTFSYQLISGTGSSGNGSFTISGNQLLTAAPLNFEAAGSYSIRVRTTDPGGLWFEKVLTISVTDVDEIAPTITSSSINDGVAQRSMVKKLAVTFSEPVTLSANALQVKLSDGTLPPNTTVTVSNPSGDQRSYVLTFSGTAVIGGSLADGIYDLIVTASGVQDLAGNVMTGNYSQRFHRLFGDSDGNKVVNALDYARLKNTLGRSPADPLFNSAFDYEANNLINALDLARFRQRYGMVYSY